MKSLSDSETRAVGRNLFEGARWILDERPLFPWHRDRGGAVTACLVQSSQALAVDVFATIQKLNSRDAIVDSWVDMMDLELRGPWLLETEHLVHAELLGEPRRSQLDVVATARYGLVVFECKFTERDGGSCSQTEPLRRGAHRGLRQCDGHYHLQRNPVSGSIDRCALSAKGVKYWTIVPEVLNLDPEADHTPCPFAGGWYQWMRNLVAAQVLSVAAGKSAAFVLAYADGPFPMAQHVGSEEWTGFRALVRKTVPLRTVSYQRLLRAATSAANHAERGLVSELTAWVDGKIAAVASRV